MNEVKVRVFEALLDASVTMTVQSEYDPTASVSRVIVFEPLVALVVALVQLPPYVIVPASSVVNV